MERNTIVQSDALDLCASLEPASVDMILADLPYGTTACEWDNVIPFAPMWAAFRRVIRPRGAIVLTASQPFTSELVMSNREMFRYEWIWHKSRAFNFFNAKHRPLAMHETVLVFSPLPAANVPDTMNYYPQDIQYRKHQFRRDNLFRHHDPHGVLRPSHQSRRIVEYTGYPSSVLRIDNEHNIDVHPTQKPVALFAYLIRTYTRPGDLVFDPVCGSGTTAVAARETGRDYICGDASAEYVKVAQDRLSAPYTPPLFVDDAPAPRSEQMSLMGDD